MSVVDYLRLHNIQIKEEKGKIYVLEQWVQNGKYGCEWIPIMKTMKEARDWLGY